LIITGCLSLSLTSKIVFYFKFPYEKNVPPDEPDRWMPRAREVVVVVAM
jgi:hypothetical protein